MGPSFCLSLSPSLSCILSVCVFPPAIHLSACLAVYFTLSLSFCYSPYHHLPISLFLTLTFHYIIFNYRLKGGDRGNISGVREDRDRDRRNSGGGGGERGPNINKPRDTAPSGVGGGGGGGGGTTEAPRPSNLSVFTNYINFIFSQDPNMASHFISYPFLTCS